MTKSAKLLALLCLLFTLGMGCGESNDNFVFTNTSPSNTTPLQGQLVFLTTPQRDAGQSFGSIQVAVQDFNGQLIESADIPILIELVDPQGATLSGTTTRNASSGIANFNDLSVDRAGNYEFRATSPGFESDDTTTFAITPAEPDILSFVQEPTSGTVGMELAAIQVELTDEFGNRTDGQVSISLASNPGSATLSGTLNRATTNGVATFDDLQLSAPGEGYTLQVSSASLTPTQSQPFDITAPAPRLVVGSTDTIRFFDASADGNTPPLRTITGSSAAVGVPCGFWLEGNELFVADCDPNGGNPIGRVAVYASGADGDTPPLRTLTGANTSLRTPLSLLIVDDELFVSDRLANGTGIILVFPADASGNATPIRTITGGNTDLMSPDNMATDGTSLFVADQIANNDAMGAVLAFPLNASGNVFPSQAIRGANTTLNGPFGIAVSPTEIFVTDVRGDSSVKVFPISVTGNTLPSRTLNVSPTVRGLALSGGELFISDSVNSVVQVYDSTASGNDAAIRSLTGAATGLTSFVGMAVGIAP